MRSAAAASFKTARGSQRANTDPARRQRARDRIVGLTRLLDTAVAIPGTNQRVGLDAALGLVPVFGDLLSAGLSVFMINEARHLGASRLLQARMLANVALDTAVGMVPVAGDLFDLVFKANQRNLRLLQKALGEPYLDPASADVDSHHARQPPK